MAEPIRPSIAVVAAGTGGHIVPGIVFAREARRAGCAAVLIAGARPVEDQVYAALGEERLRVPLRIGVNGRGRLAPWNLVGDLLAARRALVRLAPTAVLSMGGAYGVPFLIAALSAGIPIFLHESNRRPGRVTRIFSRLARHTFCGVETEMPLRSGLVTGTPVRPIPAASTRDTICFLGGSLGARWIAERGIELAPALIAANPALRVVVLGTREAADPDPRILHRPFCEDVPALLGRSLLAVSRAGASTLAELSAAGVPSVLVPYPTAKDDHQRANAQWLAAQGGAVLVDETADPPEELGQALAALLAEGGTLTRMAERSAAQHRPDASEAMISAIQSVCRAERPQAAAQPAIRREAPR